MTLFVRTDASFTVPDLPQIDTEYVPHIDGALMDFTASGLDLGPVDAWPSSISPHSMTVPGGAPQAVQHLGQRAVYTNGVDDVFRLDYTGYPHTTVTVHRYVNPQPGDAIWRAINNSEGYFNITGPGGNQQGSIGGTGSTMSPAVAPDTDWHILVTVVNGPESFVNLDGTYRSINGTDVAWRGYMLGTSVSSPYRSEAMYRRFAVIPEPVTPAHASGIVSSIRHAYGI